MIPFSLREIAPVLDAERIGQDKTILSVTTDSRTVSKSQNCLFVALKGEKFDGHNFSEHAVNSGACALLLNRPIKVDIAQLIVDDTRLALGKLGAWIRRQVSARVVALTGSSGKTSVKEMTASILRQCGRVLSTQDNLNNDIGVALTLLRLTPQHDFAVIELGANHFGEIQWTTNLVRPESALVNNIFASHLTGFRSLSGVARAKGEIFSGLASHGRGIINLDSPDCIYLRQLLVEKMVLHFSLQYSEGADFFASDIVVSNSTQHGISFILHSPQGCCPIRLPLLGRHNVANALAASALALSVGVTLRAVRVGLAELQSIPGRLFPIVLRTGQVLLDDSYNANVGSMIVAAQLLSEMPGYRVMVVSDMAELGDEEMKWHRKIGEVIEMSGIDQILSIGPIGIGTGSSIGKHFKIKRDLIAHLINLFYEKTIITVLIKGSRIHGMEDIVHVLQEKVLC